MALGMTNFIDNFAKKLYASGIANEDDPLIGCSQEEISEILNISYANCRTTLSRAKESLRKALQDVI